MSIASKRARRVLRRHVTFVTQAEFDELREYSHTLPSGTVIGRRWKRREPLARKGWVLGEYVACDIPNKVGIRWSELRVRKETA